jgi:hypothetical protein
VHDLRMMRISLAVLALIAAPLASAQEDAPVKLTLKVGKSVNLCATGTIICPATAPICDDATVAQGEESPQGLIFKGKKAGTTLCSAASSSGGGARRVYRVEVKP